MYNIFVIIYFFTFSLFSNRKSEIIKHQLYSELQAYDAPQIYDTVNYEMANLNKDYL
jgi:hypothetical protein